MTIHTEENKSSDGSGWVYMFPGQGSQFIGMCKDVYESSPACKEILDTASDVSGKNLTKLCFSGPISKLSNTDNLQVAMTAANLSLAKFLEEETQIRPSVVLGHSVGEYSALHTAGVLSMSDTLKATAQRGVLMQREAKAQKGLMYAVKNCAPSDLNQILLDHFPRNAIVIANDNSVNQQVASGNKADMTELAKVLADKGIEYVKLPVSGAWHSPLMNGCVEEYAHYLADIAFSEPMLPVIGNIPADYVTNPTEIREQLVTHIVGMVRWRESVELLLSRGHTQFIEVGPKKVLSRLLDSINADRYDLTIKSVESVSDIRAL